MYVMDARRRFYNDTAKNTLFKQEKLNIFTPYKQARAHTHRKIREKDKTRVRIRLYAS